jgi:hypothetical protein
MEVVWQYGERLLSCIHQTLADTDAGAPERHCQVPGGIIAWDDCDCGGQLTVHVATEYPADTFPLQKLTGPFNCTTRLTVVEYVATILRCVPTQTDHGHSPSCVKQSAAAHQAAQDRWALRRGAMCCFAADNRLSAPEVLLQEARSIGGEGKCAGSEVHVLVGFSNCVACDDIDTGSVYDGGTGDFYPATVLDGGAG